MPQVPPADRFSMVVAAFRLIGVVPGDAMNASPATALKLSQERS